MLTLEQKMTSARCIRAAIRAGALQPVKKDFFLSEEPAISIACGDFTQEERWGHCKKVVADKLQSIELHGGGFLLDPLSKENELHSHIDTIRHQIKRGVEAKAAQGYNIRTLVVFYDWLCGIGVDHAMGAEDVFWNAIHGKRFTKDPHNKMLPGKMKDWKVKMLFYLHDLSVLGDEHPLVIEHPSATALTFYFGRKEMEKFLEQWKSQNTEEDLVSQ